MAIKVLFLVPSFSDSGPQVVNRSFYRALVDSGFEATNIALYSDARLGLQIKSKIHLIRSIIKADVVVSNGFLPDLLIAIFSRFIFSTKISILHNCIDEEFDGRYSNTLKSILYKTWRYSLNHIDFLIAPSIDISNRYRSILKEPKLYELMYTIEVPKILPAVSDKELMCYTKKFAITLGSVGHLIPRKGYDQIIDLLCAHPDVCFLLIGDGAFRQQLEQKAQLNNVLHQIKFLGHQADPISYYKHFDIYINTSYSEGFSVSLQQAFALGLPVLVTDIPSHQIIKRYCATYCCDMKDATQFGNKLHTIASNIDKYSYKSLSFYKEFLSYERYKNQVRDIVNESFYNKFH